MKAKILAPESIKEWRTARSRGISVIAGSFAILQPGNLSAILRARELAGETILILEPATKFKIGGVDEAIDQRDEFLSYLAGISAVCDPGDRFDFIEQLRPFTMIDCLSQAGPSRLREALRRAAQEIEDIAPVPGCFTEDIASAIQNNRTPVHIPGLEDFATGPNIEALASWRREGRKFATVNGCFDMLHLGHARMLAGAREKADELVVLVNDDASVRAYKGDDRPIFPIRFRLQALAAFESVSLACAFSGDNPLEMLTRLRPDIHVKGGTYERARVQAESELLESWGGKVDFCPLVKGYSTTRMVEPVRR